MQTTLSLPATDQWMAPPPVNFDTIVEKAVVTLTALLKKDVLAVAWSSGKDSTACLILTLIALERLKTQGIEPAGPTFVQHGSTGVENDVVADEMGGRTSSRHPDKNLRTEIGK
jgi:3'-phosphoadenosine 5'-phosphosulfate sulfotransferase (PAPS reductase)/FAD synthetase